MNEESWNILKEKLKAARADALKGQLGSREMEDVTFLQGTILGIEGALTLIEQLETRKDEPDGEEDE